MKYSVCKHRDQSSVNSGDRYVLFCGDHTASSTDPHGCDGSGWPELTALGETETCGRHSGRSRAMEDFSNLGPKKLLNIDGNDINIKYSHLSCWKLIEFGYFHRNWQHGEGPDNLVSK